jgi:AcrR family transcriptional regulator
MSRPPLTRERVADAALALIDSDDLPALSMRKLGAALGVEAMSLYNHVANKDDLLVAVGDLLYQRIEERYHSVGASTWQDRARAMAFAYWHVGREHPNAFSLVTVRPVESRAGMRMLAAAVSIFTDAGFTVADAATAFNTAAGWIVGTVEQELKLMRALAHGWTADGDAPAEAAAVAAFRDASLSLTPDERFAAGLEVVMNGLETWHGSRRARSRQRAAGR